MGFMRLLVIIVVVSVTVSVLTVGLVAPALAQGYRGPTRVNFDERLIKGQTTKAGSVYIFDRQQSELRSLVSRQRQFRHKTIITVFEE